MIKLLNYILDVACCLVIRSICAGQILRTHILEKLIFPVMFLLGCFLVIMSIYKTYILEKLKNKFFLSCYVTIPSSLNMLVPKSSVLSTSQIKALPSNVHCQVGSLEGGKIAPIALEDVHPGDLDAVPVPEAVLGTRGNTHKLVRPHFDQNMGKISSSTQTQVFLGKQKHLFDCQQTAEISRHGRVARFEGC